MDGISNLPDCILLHILSFLPTKTAVLTTALSRRWSHLCHDLQHLDFNQFQFQPRNYVCSDNATRMRLFAVVYRILSRYGAPPVRSFRLTCCLVKFDEYTVEWFVSKVLGPKLEELSLQLSFIGLSDRNVVIPHGVFSCTSLVTLRLTGDITILSNSSPSRRYDLPSLKTLELHYVKASVRDVAELLDHCIALENLFLYLDGPYNKGGYTIRVPSSLKSLHLNSVLTFGCLVIETPSLKCLDIEVRQPLHISVRYLHHVEEASINLVSQAFVRRFLVLLWRIRSLVLGFLVFDCLVKAPPRLIPEFNCLHRLELAVRCFDTRYIMNMLEKCRVLEVLAIVFITDKDPEPARKWEQPFEIPTCLASHLQVIKIIGYFESGGDRAFFAYVLQHGLVLKSLDIQVDTIRAKVFPEELSFLPRSSKACQINFSWN